MKANVTIKALSAAVLGLAGMAFAGSSMAACPTDAAQPAGAWSGKVVVGGGALAITTPGLKATECAASASINAGAGGLATAVVRDDTPAAETRYRFRFYLNTDALTGFGGVQGAQIFTANSTNPFPAVGGSTQILRIALVPGGATGKRLNFIAACNDPGVGYQCSSITPLAATGTVNVVEGEIVIGGAGTGKINYWVNNNVAATATGTINLDNAAWTGVDTTFLGLSNATATFRTNQATKAVVFDEFDSRRQTFIGF